MGCLLLLTSGPGKAGSASPSSVRWKNVKPPALVLFPWSWIPKSVCLPLTIFHSSLFVAICTIFRVYTSAQLELAGESVSMLFCLDQKFSLYFKSCLNYKLQIYLYLNINLEVYFKPECKYHFIHTSAPISQQKKKYIQKVHLQSSSQSVFCK